MKTFLIKSTTECDPEADFPLYWSNEEGWADRELATRFNEEEIKEARLVGGWEPEEVEEIPESDLDEFVDAYIECALWSTTDNSDENGGEPFDTSYGPDDLTKETYRAMRKDCEDFLKENYEDIPRDRYKQAGHDFWLTREGHGSGYWDGGWPHAAGQRLTKSSKNYGSFNLMLGEDGKIHGD